MPETPLIALFGRALTLALGWMLASSCAEHRELPCAPPDPARYTRALNSLSQAPVLWPFDGCIPYRLDHRASEGERDLLHQAFATWSAPACTELCFAPLGLTEPELHPPEAAFIEAGPNDNVVVFIDPAFWPFDPETLAATSVTSNLEGRILDADISLNTQALSGADLQNVATHEVGHVIGLGHTTLASSTMYGDYQPGETLKRTLDEGDIDAVCTLYRAACHPLD